MTQPGSETPRDSLPGTTGRERRLRIAAALGVGLVGTASLSTAVFQSITQASTSLGMPGAVEESGGHLPWGTPTPAVPGALPGAASPAITPTLADLDLRADRQALPVPPGSPDALPVPGGLVDPGAGAPTADRGRGAPASPGRSRTPRTTGPTTGPTTRPSTEPTTEPTTSPTGPTGEPTGEPTTGSSTATGPAAPPSGPAGSGPSPADGGDAGGGSSG